MKNFLIAILVFSMIPIFPCSTGLFAQDEDLISIDFRNTEIGDALRLLAKQHDLNIILSENVRGPITVQFSNVTVDEAIDAIITINGYAYSKRDNVIKVTTPEAAEYEPATTRLFKLVNATASDLRETFKNVLSPMGKVEIDSRSNSLIVTDNSNSIERIGNLIQNLDEVTPQIMIEARVIETILSDSDKLGINWTVMATAAGAKRPTTFPFNANRPRSEDLGKYIPSADTTAAEFPGAQSFPYTTTGSSDGVLQGDFVFGTLDFSQLSAILELLNTRSKTTVLSNPRIVTIDNKEARVLVGTRIPIPTYERNEATGTFEISGYEEESVGISLQVTPQVNHEGYIKMKLYPVVSSIIGYTGPNNERPIISTREAETEVIIKNGETVAIGGLIKEENIDSKKRVPILGSIPVLSFFFKKNEDTKDKTDLLIFVTAHILNDQKTKMLTDEVIEYSGRKEVFVKEEEKRFKPKKDVVISTKPYKPAK